MNMLSRAVKSLSRSLQRAAGWRVDIRRGGTSYVSGIKGVLTMKEYQVFDNDLLPWKKTVADWILPQCEIKKQALTIEAGDQIVVCGHAENSQEVTGRTFTVQPIGARPCVEPHDDYGVMVVVHTEEQP
jgi:hypothetical protein